MFGDSWKDWEVSDENYGDCDTVKTPLFWAISWRITNYKQSQKWIQMRYYYKYCFVRINC